jgi:hypothetical protein
MEFSIIKMVAGLQTKNYITLKIEIFLKIIGVKKIIFQLLEYLIIN